MAFQQFVDVYYLAIIKDTVPIIEIDFQSEGIIPETVLLTGFISAMSAFSKEFIRGELKTIDQGEYKLTYVEGNRVSVFVISSLISDNLRLAIQSILTEFEEKYGEILEKLNWSSAEYEEFRKKIIDDIYKFKSGLIKEYFVPKIGNRSIENFNTLDTDAKLILSAIDGTLDANELSKHTGISIRNTIHILTSLVAQKIIDFEITVDAYDIPKMTTIGLNELFNSPELHQDILSTLGNQWSQIIKKIDGKTSINDLSEKFTINLLDMKQVMTQLNKKEYITLQGDEVILCLMFERFYERLFRRVKDLMGTRGEAMFRKKVEDEPNVLRNLIIFDEDKISFDKILLHVESQPNVSFDIVSESLVPPIIKILKNVKKFHGSKYVQKLKNNIISEMLNEFSQNNTERFSNFLMIDD